ASSLGIYRWFRKESWLPGLALLAAAHLYGLGALAYWHGREQGAETCRVGVVQGNLGYRPRDVPHESFANRAAQAMWDQTRRLLEENPGVDLVVWPEASVPASCYKHVPAWLMGLATLQVPILFEDVEDHYNIARYRPPGGPEQIYRKNILMPFGEFLPVPIPGLPYTPGLRAARERVLFHTVVGDVMPLICYEALPPDYSRRFDRDTGRRARLIVNLCADGYFDSAMQCRQSFALSALRPVELRVPMIRANNAGISAYIDTLGRVHDPIPAYRSDNRVYSVRLPERRLTLFGLWGMWPYWAYLSAMLGLVAWSFRSSR
ncbi:MAG: nitrilase-related carbon-nitrogen hydrolase, partial [Candidatus Eremiobacterota bacterium]